MKREKNKPTDERVDPVQADLPKLHIGEISPLAKMTARILVDAFFYQDRAEQLLRNGNTSAAMAFREDAQRAMETVYCIEFPHVQTEHAEHAGRIFMTALFMQDEIENGEVITNNNDDICDRLTLSLSQQLPSEDPKLYWADVRKKLHKVCTLTNTAAEYVDYQVNFWQGHGDEQYDIDYESAAVAAQKVKLEAMTQGTGNEETYQKLGRYFIVGVRVHDQWSKHKRDEYYDKLLSIVERYYEKVFSLQNRIDR